MKRDLVLDLGASVLAALVVVVPAAAQEPSPDPTAGKYARIVVIEPRPGMASAFEAGYQRHIEWHRDQRDPWTWYGWSFVLGERLGLFMDGTFGHAAPDFDRAVRPAADAADNVANVVPYAEFRSHAVYERMDLLGRGAPLPDTSAFLALETYRVVPSKERAFEAALAEFQRQPSEDSGRYTWFRLRIGGAAPQYLLMRPVPTLAAAAELPAFWHATTGAAGSTASVVDGLVESVHSELLRYRPNLSYHP